MHQRVQTAPFCLLVLSLIIVGATQTSAQPCQAWPSRRLSGEQDRSIWCADEREFPTQGLNLAKSSGPVATAPANGD